MSRETGTPTFTKEQIVGASKYTRYRDFLQGNLEDNRTYTFKEVDKLILRNYRKVGK